MAKQQPVEEKIEVRERVDVKLPRKEVEHIIRCWIDHTMGGIPKPQNFNDIEVRFECYALDDAGGDTLISATVTYAPAPRESKAA